MSEHEISLTVDGAEESLRVPARRLLVHVLRDHLGYTAPKVGCESGKCGACTVQIDGEPVKSCMVLGVQAGGCSIRTAADLADDELTPLQEAFREARGLQCGYCTPGMLMTVDALLEDQRPLDRETIREELKGNICRCTGYHAIVDAVERAAAQRGE